MAPKAAIALAVAFSALLASAATIDRRIVQGQDAKDGEIKFIVSLRDENKTHNCGGSLLDGYTVLTAAHCIEYGPELVSVTAGTVDIKTKGVEARVASFKKHPDYKPGFDTQERWEENDIAILKLATPIAKSDTIDYATLPLAGSDAEANSTAIAAGWGVQTPISVTYTPGGKKHVSAKALSKVVLPILAREECAQYKGVGDRDTIVCAGGEGKNVCKADSGGPLFNEETGELLGVVSWSIKANGEYCNKGPGLFSKVSSYIDFINENLGSGSNSDPISREENLKKLEALRAKEKKICEDIGKDLDECRPQVAECAFRARGQKNSDVGAEAVWKSIKECVKEIFG